MITSISKFNLLGVQRSVTTSYHATVLVKELTLQGFKETTLAIHSPGVSGKWFWSDSNRAAPLCVELLADDFQRDNAELWCSCEQRGKTMFIPSPNHIASQYGKQLQTWSTTQQRIKEVHPNVSTQQVNAAEKVWAAETVAERDARSANDD